MRIEKQTEKGLLLNKNGIEFWIQKRWMKADGTLSPAGWKAYHIAKRTYERHLGFDALNEFDLVYETDRAVLLRCTVVHPEGNETESQFWLPKTMTANFDFVSKKMKEIEAGFPFHGTYVKYSGRTVPRQKRKESV